MDEYQGKIRLVIKFYPYKYRDFAHIAAQAALSARSQGKFEQMHYKMLAESPRLDRASLVRYALEIGIDSSRVASEIEKMNDSATIERDKKLAVDMDLYNTPALFVNGRRILGNVPYEYLKKAIVEELDAIGRK